MTAAIRMPLPLKHRSGLSLTRWEGGPYDERAERKRRDSLSFRIIIVGVAGRDFHNVNRGSPSVKRPEVVLDDSDVSHGHAQSHMVLAAGAARP
jgi:hypothetical protein